MGIEVGAWGVRARESPIEREMLCERCVGRSARSVLLAAPSPCAAAARRRIALLGGSSAAVRAVGRRRRGSGLQQLGRRQRRARRRVDARHVLLDVVLEDAEVRRRGGGVAREVERRALAGHLRAHERQEHLAGLPQKNVQYTCQVDHFSTFHLYFI